MRQRTPPRGLSEAESEAWAQLAATVRPLDPPRKGEGGLAQHGEGGSSGASRPGPPLRPPPPRVAPPTKPTGRNPPGNLDSHWDRRLKAGEISPELSLDLHGHGLDRAYERLMDGMAQARAMGARTVLVVTGKPRPVDPADRGIKRGAIRAKILDWLAASEHGSSIAAVRTAHRKHGGDGALYLVLRR